MKATKSRITAVAVLLTALIIVAASPLYAGPGAFTTPVTGKSFDQIVTDPANSKVVYAAGNDSNNNPYVYKSFDGGNTWAATGSGIGQMAVFALAVSKPNDNIVYVGGYNFSTHTIALYQSQNGGASWNQVATSLGDNSVQAIALDPTNPLISYLGLNHGVAKSIDGVNWNMAPGMSGNNVQALVIDRSTTPVLYAGVNGNNPGVWKSADSSQSWAAVNTNIPSGNVFFLAVDYSVNSTIYAGVAASPTSSFTIAKTTNSGQSWASMATTDQMTALAVDPLNGLNIYYESISGLYRSGDGAATWSQIYQTGGGGFAADANNPQTLYSGSANGIATYTAAPPPAITPTPSVAPTPTPVANPATTPPGTGQSFTFTQTGHTVSGIWFDFLKGHGDVDNLGYPRTEVIVDKINTTQTVQYFQRLVLEYHPEQAAPYQLQRRLLGDIMYPGVDPAVDPNANRPPGDVAYFPNNPGQGTGHFVANVAPDGSPTLFKQYFDSHGKEDAFGYPKEEPHQRQLADGTTHWTQRFQAAVFEYHGENDKDGNNANGVPFRNFRVQLELLGDEYIAKNNLPFK